MATSFLLVHAPLLGPTSWQPCAELLESEGHRVAVPDLRDSLSPGSHWWDRAASRAAEALVDFDDVLVAGHSGAGLLLPLVAERVRASGVVFVDAVLPVMSGMSRTSEQMRELIQSISGDDGLLPAWSTWWEPGTMAELVPDAVLRRAIEAEQVRLSADFYDEDVPVPDNWPPDNVSYLQLSPAYDDAAAKAAARGWAVSKLWGQHLDIVRRPAAVVDAILEVTGVRAP